MWLYDAGIELGVRRVDSVDELLFDWMAYDLASTEPSGIGCPERESELMRDVFEDVLNLLTKRRTRFYCECCGLEFEEDAE